MNNLFNIKSYYVVYKHFSVATAIEYNLFDFNTARDKAMVWTSERLNSKAIIFSVAAKDANPKEEFVVSNQYVEERQVQKVS